MKVRLGAALLTSLALSGPSFAQGTFDVNDVEEAVQKGAKWLTTAPLPGARFRGRARAGACSYYDLGYEALTCFALLRSGVDPKLLEERFQRMRRVTFTHTYCVSAYVLALEAKHVTRVRVERAKRSKTMKTQARVAVFKRKLAGGGDVAEIFRAAKWLVAANSGKGIWSYTSMKRSSVRIRRRAAARYDNSNTQFAVYALHAAAAAGYEVPVEVWQEIAEHFLNVQEPRGDAYSLDGVRFGRHAAPSSKRGKLGKTKARKRKRRSERRNTRARGWSYSMRSVAYASMSAAGLGCVAMAEERLLGKASAAELGQVLGAKLDGIAWLVRSVRTGAKGRGHGHRYYYLWSLEKAFDATGVEEVARGHHWWREGANWLLKEQKPNGSWSGGLTDTAFALLFLNRGTLPMWEDGQRFGRVKTGAERVEPGPWDLTHLKDGTPSSVTQTLTILAKAGSEKTARETLKEARQGFVAMGPGERGNLVGLLVPLLDSEYKSVRRWSKKALGAVIGDDDPEAARAFASAWKALVVAGKQGDLTAAGRARELLRRPDAHPRLRRRALQTLVQLRAAEAVPDLVDQLLARDAEYRQFAWTMLYSLAGPQRPFDPIAPKNARVRQVKAWRSWWKTDGGAWEQRERIARDVLALSRKATREEARARLLRSGRSAIPRLIAALEDPRMREGAHELLRSIAGERFPAEPEPWRAWWRRGG